MFKISINPKWCKGCGICADFCPKNVYDFTMGSTPEPARSKDCIGCKQCELKCPDLAIKVEKAKEDEK
jgi:2-oxoglutarate ferredoxin oxidoreductase subunit delta